MHRIESFESPIEAQSAVLFLLRNGVIARVHFLLDTNFIPLMRSARGAVCELHIADKGERELALALLGAWRDEPGDQPVGWEAGAEPDLRLLDPAIEIRCDRCRADLDTAAERGRCPSCGLEYDTIQRVVETHGPEALESCYPPPDELIDDAVLTELAVPCPACDYPLGGLPAEGPCPECGRGYDKHAIVQRYVFG